MTTPTPDGTLARRPRVQSAARAVEMLVLIAQTDEGLTVKELCEALGISRQVAYHMLHTLTESGVVRRNGRDRYVLGLRIGTLVQGFGRQLLPASELAPIARRLTQETGETASAAGWLDGEITTFFVSQGAYGTALEHAPYQMRAPHSRAAGKLLLSLLDERELTSYLERRPLKREAPATITNRRALVRELDAIREQRYAKEIEESHPGKCALAVPLDDEMSTPFCVALHVPAERFATSFDGYLATARRVVVEGRRW